jgi:hypothetical protein
MKYGNVWPMPTQPSLDARDDAQRALEQRALRNVRGLVDKLEDDDRAKSRRAWRHVAASVVVALLAALALYLAMTSGSSKQAIVVSPAKPASSAPAR